MTDELLRKMAALVTDVSPQTSTLAMEFLELLFERIPTDPEEDDTARMLMPSLVLVGMMMDALICRLADAKVHIVLDPKTKTKSILKTCSIPTYVDSNTKQGEGRIDGHGRQNGRNDYVT